MGHYGGSYKVTYDLYKKYGDMRLLDTPICGEGTRCPPCIASRTHSIGCDALPAYARYPDRLARHK